SEELFSELYADVLSDCPSDFEFSDSDSDDSDIRPSKRQRRILSDSEADSDEEWNDIDIVPSLEDYSRNSRVPNFECDPPSIVDVIDSFFDDEFFNLVVSQTNLYHTQMKDLHKNSAKTLQWKEVTTNDMKKFLGLLEELMKYSNSPLSKVWPARLDPAYNNATGKWDPERWFMNHRSDRLMPLDEPRSKRERQDDSIVSHKRKSSDPKERIKEEKDDIVLSPQRRSFGTGCHVIQQSSLARRPGSPTDGRDPENFREPSRRIGSGRIITRDRDQRDWERDREYGYGNRNDRRDRFDQDDSDKDLRRYSGRYRTDRRSRSGRDRIDEVEPEWFSGGPTSQSETIELVGFEDPHNDGENRKPAKKKRSKQNSRRSSLKSDEG
ncbi:hypothetical protein AVEN_34277-1, partial [Araneus ventricosus]